MRVLHSHRAARSRSRATLLVATLLGCALLTACGADRPQPERVTIDSARRSGTHVTAKAEGFINRPLTVAIRVSATPKQRVVVTWGLSCPKRKNASHKGTGGTYAATAPDVRPLRLPRRRIAFCAVRGEARLSRKGRVRVTLLGSRRPARARAGSTTGGGG